MDEASQAESKQIHKNAANIQGQIKERVQEI